MANNTKNARIQFKHDTAANWAKAVNFIPLAGEIIVYDTDGDTPVKFKIGDGINYVNVLPFVNKDIIEKTDLSSELQDYLTGIELIAKTKADWNQNDSTAIDYVKNRTHWAEQEYETIVPATSETNYIEPILEYYLFSGSHIVTVDGIEYECESFMNELGELCLGDSRLYNNQDQTNPIDVPFYVVSYMGISGGGFFGDEVALIDVLYPDSNTHTIEIKKPTGNTTYHTLDENYIPETIARVSDVNDAINAASITVLTEAEIDEICNATIQYAEGAMF